MAQFRILAAGAVSAAIIVSALAGPAAAQQRGYDRWGRYEPFGISRYDRRAGQVDDSREGRVSAAHFVAAGAQARLGRGPIQLVVLPDSTPTERDMLDYESALLDRLGSAGYDISGTGQDAPQTASIRIVRTVAEPAEQRRSPVSGETAVSVSNRGSAVGMALNLDFTKPRTALLSTLMEVQIHDRQTGEVMWEGRANILTRADDPDWGEDDIANQLAAAMLRRFPESDD